MRVLKKFLLAVSAVTALPLADLHHDPHALEGLSKYLPLVGLLIGVILSLIAIFAANVCHASALSIGILLTIGWLVLSGGIHFDGLMDTADGIFSHRSPERMLEIMHDSRVGNFGVLTGVSVLLLKLGGIAALAKLQGSSCPISLPSGQSINLSPLVCALLLIPMWSRWCETYAIGRFQYLREQGLGKIWHDTTKFPRDIICAAILPILVTAVAWTTFGACALTYCAGTLVCGLLSAHHVGAILKGHTGDTYGAVVELAEGGGLLLCMLCFHCGTSL